MTIIHMAQMGRPPAPARRLPDVSPFVDEVARSLQHRHPSQIKPIKAARLLTLAVLLHWLDQPWPTRQQLTEHLDLAPATISVVRTQYQALGYLLTPAPRLTSGNIKRRRSTITEIRWVPSSELIDIVAAAVRHWVPSPELVDRMAVVARAFNHQVSGRRRKT